jgi:hypothetical protein
MVFTTVTINTDIFWDITPWALVGTDVLGESIASIFRVTTIDELGTTLAVTWLRPSVAGYC